MNEATLRMLKGVVLGISVLIFYFVVCSKPEEEEQRRRGGRRIISRLAVARGSALGWQSKVLEQLSSQLELLRAALRDQDRLTSTGVGVLLCFSMGSLGASVLVLAWLTTVLPSLFGFELLLPLRSLVWLQAWSALFAMLGATPLLLLRAGSVVLWRLAVLAALAMGIWLVHSHFSGWRFMQFLGPAIIAGCMAAEASLRLASWTVRRLDNAKTWYLAAAYCGIPLLVAIGLSVLPLAVALFLLRQPAPTFAGESLMLAAVTTQASVLLLCITTAALLVAMHCAAWPAIQRPVEALVRHDLLVKRRGLFFGAAAAGTMWALGLELPWLSDAGGLLRAILDSLR